MGYLVERRLLLSIAGLALVRARPARAQDWKAEWQATIAKAKGQSLSLALQQGDGYGAVVDTFRREFPDIVVETTVSAPAAFAPRVVTEQQNGVFAWDSWWSTAANMSSIVMPVGGFDKITDYFILPEVSDFSNWRNPRFLYTSDRGPYVFIHTNTLEFQSLYNSDQLPGKAFTSIDLMLDARLKGRIVIREPNRPHGGTEMLAVLAKEKGLEFVKRLFQEMSPRFVDNDRQLTNEVINGDAAIGLGTSDPLYTQCVNDGGCRNVHPLPIAYMDSRAIAVFKNAPHKEATKVWVNWILSKVGQESYVREWGKYSSSGAFSNRIDVKPDPSQVNSIPDYAHLDRYVAVCFDSGARELDVIMKLYKELRQ
jgi:iron(III) transport system substrate-binding protein